MALVFFLACNGADKTQRGYIAANIGRCCAGHAVSVAQGRYSFGWHMAARLSANASGGSAGESGLFTFLRKDVNWWRFHNRDQYRHQCITSHNAMAPRGIVLPNIRATAPLLVLLPEVESDVRHAYSLQYDLCKTMPCNWPAIIHVKNNVGIQASNTSGAWQKVVSGMWLWREDLLGQQGDETEGHRPVKDSRNVFPVEVS